MNEVTDTDSDDPAIGEFDPGLTPVLKTYSPSEVRGLNSFPPGGALANHSGSMFPMDVPVFSVDFYDTFGYIQANPKNAAAARRSGSLVVVFPRGDSDAYRPTIGGQATQLHLPRSTWLAQWLGIKRLPRSDILPLSFGFPFGFSAAIPPKRRFPILG